MTYEQAIATLVAHDVANWGERERAASQRMHLTNSPTIGLALNAVAHLDLDNIDHDLANKAQRVMTAADQRALRDGG